MLLEATCPWCKSRATAREHQVTRKTGDKLIYYSCGNLHRCRRTWSAVVPDKAAHFSAALEDTKLARTHSCDAPDCETRATDSSAPVGWRCEEHAGSIGYAVCGRVKNEHVCIRPDDHKDSHAVWLESGYYYSWPQEPEDQPKQEPSEGLQHTTASHADQSRRHEERRSFSEREVCLEPGPCGARCDKLKGHLDLHSWSTPLRCEFPDCHEMHPTLLGGDPEGEGWTCGRCWNSAQHCCDKDMGHSCSRPVWHSGGHLLWTPGRTAPSHRWPREPDIDDNGVATRDLPPIIGNLETDGLPRIAKLLERHNLTCDYPDSWPVTEAKGDARRRLREHVTGCLDGVTRDKYTFGGGAVYRRDHTSQWRLRNEADTGWDDEYPERDNNPIADIQSAVGQMYQPKRGGW